MKSDGRDKTPNSVQIDTKKTCKARWVYHIPIQKSNNEVYLLLYASQARDIHLCLLGQQ